ncbi:MAG: riboflavin synthase subunit alpha [Pseudomonadota bacterium]
MFTGIVQDLVEVVEVTPQPGMVCLSVNLGGLTDSLQLGASVAVNGVCLTVTKIEQSTVSFDVIAETLSLTNLGDLATGVMVNVERSFTVGTEVGGHIVSGHVTGLAALVERRVEGNDHVIRLECAPSVFRYLFHKGFVAIDGASLTISDIDKEAGWFEISLIPETLARTTLSLRGIGDQFNVEVEAQTVTAVDTIERMMADPEWITRLKELSTT